jgi:hypothetical protein
MKGEEPETRSYCNRSFNNQSEHRLSFVGRCVAVASPKTLSKLSIKFLPWGDLYLKYAAVLKSIRQTKGVSNTITP